MTSQRCLYALLHAPREHHDEILHALVRPIALEIGGNAALDSLFFARYDLPRWQVRFRILGRPEWVDGDVRRLVEGRLPALQDRGLIEGCEFAEYEREYERYGGEEGMALAEQVFLHDSLACLDLMDVEHRGHLARSRREVTLVLTERVLDLLEMDRAQRLAFYRSGYQWAIDGGTWRDEEQGALEERYRSLAPGLEELFLGATARDPVALYGGAEAAAIARRFLDSVRPVASRLLEAHRAGRIPKNLVTLAWSYTHMQCNRLGIDPAAEAILRFFMLRFAEDHPGTGA
ncbi:MAG TPA: thiopeptide-type bacteriocin biosynthesis protein [Candidatus Polarisedimenticolia bacterium]|jgi:thiopeptide-type bacteriocin biosynthesis protein|nr:thiopeptide-type bacteriocin biosynthesis protein [Candidatus Polarisedimenticolia bacterium]